MGIRNIGSKAGKVLAETFGDIDSLSEASEENLMGAHDAISYGVLDKWENIRTENGGKCKQKCPYGLDTPALLRKNYEDYKTFL